MGEEADNAIRRMVEGPRASPLRRAKAIPGRPLLSILTKGETITTEKLAAQHISWKDPARTLENMPEDIKAEIAKCSSEHQRAIRILAWLQDIPMAQAHQRYNDYRRREREAEKEEEHHREKRERLEQLSAAQTLEELKPLLAEIIELLWSPK